MQLNSYWWFTFNMYFSVSGQSKHLKFSIYIWLVFCGLWCGDALTFKCLQMVRNFNLFGVMCWMDKWQFFFCGGPAMSWNLQPELLFMKLKVSKVCEWLCWCDTCLKVNWWGCVVLERSRYAWKLVLMAFSLAVIFSVSGAKTGWHCVCDVMLLAVCH